MQSFRFLADRTAVLFLGVAAGVAIGYAFAGGGDEVPVTAPTPVAETVAPPPRILAPGQPQPEPPLVAPPTPAAAEAIPDITQPRAGVEAAIASGRKVRVGVFGDSFGDGVWSGLYRLLPAKDDFEVVKFSQQSTGFTRYRSLNLEEHLREQLAEGPVDVAVISFGANDTQGVLVGGHAARLMSDEWQQVIGDRIAGYVTTLRNQGAMVFWIGLPKMRKAGFDADISGMNGFYARKMTELGVPFVATAPLTVDGAGQYAPYLPDGPDGKRTLIRANDGIHMSMNGYVRITRALATRIRNEVAAVRGPAVTAITPPPAPVGAGTPS